MFIDSDSDSDTASVTQTAPLCIVPPTTTAPTTGSATTAVTTASYSPTTPPPPVLPTTTVMTDTSTTPAPGPSNILYVVYLGPSTSATAAPAVGQAVKTCEVSFAPPPFHGAPNEDADCWLSQFEKYVTYRGMTKQDKINFLAAVLRDDAGNWFDDLTATTRATWHNLKAAFEVRFKDSDIRKYHKASSLWNRVQGATETVDGYVTAMRKLASAVDLDDVQLRFAIQRGLRQELIGPVIQSQPTSIDGLINAARLAEAAASATAAAKPDISLAKNCEVAERNTEQIKHLADQLTTHQSVNVIDNGTGATARPRYAPPERR